MRVLTVGSMYPPHSTGGYELVWEGTVNYMREQGHDVRVMASDHRMPGRRDTAEHVTRELRWYWKDHAWPRLGMLERIRLERHNAVLLDRALRDFRPEVVSWWAMGGMSLSMIERVRAAGIPMVAIVCDDWLIYGPRVDAWMRLAQRPVVGAALSRLSGIPAHVDLGSGIHYLFASDTLRRRARDEGVEVGDATVSHRGIDRDLFRPAPVKPWEWRLLYVGRIDRRKGIDLAVKALAELPSSATLDIFGAGDGAYLAELKSLAEQLGLGGRVRFGVARYEELPAIYAAADAVIFPVRWEEPWGLVPQEAMAVGTPVVATGRGGSGEYLRDGENCLVFDPGLGTAALSRALQRLSGDARLRERLRQGGSEMAAGLTISRWDRDIESLHRRALERRAS